MTTTQQGGTVRSSSGSSRGCCSNGLSNSRGISRHPCFQSVRQGSTTAAAVAALFCWWRDELMLHYLWLVARGNFTAPFLVNVFCCMAVAIQVLASYNSGRILTAYDESQHVPAAAPEVRHLLYTQDQLIGGRKYTYDSAVLDFI